MASKNSGPLTPLELEIMNVLWEQGEANVQSVQAAMKRELAYTTVQTMLNILARKGRVKRAKRDRAFFYKPVVSHEQVAQNAVHDIVQRMFGGSPENLVMSLLESRELTPEKLKRLQKMVSESQKAAAEDAHGKA